jgi:aminopeptidase
MEDTRIRKLARFMISDAVSLQKGERILIEQHGGTDRSLMLALVEEVYQAGGRPFVHIFDYELEGAVLQVGDEELLSEIASYEIARMKNMDAYIDIRVQDNLYVWGHLGKEKIANYRKGYWGPLHLNLRCQETKWSVLHYPTDSVAQMAGMNTREFEDFFFRSSLLDYRKMGQAMTPLVELMDRTDRVRIVSPGTDLSFSIKGIGSVPMNGQGNIPDGEIYTAPVRDSVNGTIRYNIDSYFQGFVFKDVAFTFKDGKIVHADGNDPDRINKILDTDEGARYIGEFAFGVNPEITRPITNIIYDEKMVGSIHFTPGNCYKKSDNGNVSALHWDLILAQNPEFGGGEIYFDDVLIRKDGRFVLPELDVLNPENLR